MRLRPAALLSLATLTLVVAANCEVRTLNTVLPADAGSSGGAGASTFIPATGGHAGFFGGATGGIAAGSGWSGGASGGALGCSIPTREGLGPVEPLLTPDGQQGAPNLVPHFVGASNVPQFVQLADLTADGKVDLIFQEANQLRMRPGMGDGTFASVEVPVLAESSLLAWSATDLNGDRLADLVLTPDGGADAVMVRLNRGGGDMAPPLFFGTNSSPPWLPALVADFTGDGLPDVALPGSEKASGSQQMVRLLVNSGVGTFRFPIEFPTTGTTALLAGDADGDGRTDLLSLGPCANYDVLRADGLGGFAAAAPFAGIGFADSNMDRTSSAFADLNGDGRADLVTTYGFLDRLRVMLNDGNGSFVLAEQRLLGALGTVRLHDLNGDGAVDIVVASRARTGLVVLLGMGDGHFSKPFSYITHASVSDFAIGDVNADRRADIVVVGVGSPPESGITVLLNTPR